VLGVAAAVVDGGLALEALAAGSAVTAERTLTSLHGVGTWTARYTLMRGMGFADCAPIGDVALAAALQRCHGLDARPSPDAVEALLAPFSPHRSLATCHLWASLQDRA
jgi:3-methyladenine DNA glycosylase/8-oxoguanine DNA glycosylase